MTKKSPLEFYDEELSRTIRQIQEMLMEVEWPSVDKTEPSQEDQLATIDKLLTTCGIFVQQIELDVRRMERGDPDKKQWQEIVKFRKATLGHLAKERSNVQIFEFPAMESGEADTKGTTA